VYDSETLEPLGVVKVNETYPEQGPYLKSISDLFKGAKGLPVLIVSCFQNKDHLPEGVWPAKKSWGLDSRDAKNTEDCHIDFDTMEFKLIYGKSLKAPTTAPAATAPSGTGDPKKGN
jgi:hypothetical protein